MKKIDWFALTLVSIIFVFSQLSMAAEPTTQAAEPPVADSNLLNTVDINSADASTLALVLEGVGMTKAQEIIAHRERHGKFKSVEELIEVKGIGQATVDKNRDRIKIIH